MTDEALMTEVSHDDLDKASELYDRYSKRLYNYFVKISMDRELGHDLTQNTFYRVIKYRKSYKPDRPFKAWLFQIGRNVFADHLKDKKVRTSDFHDVQQVAAIDGTHEDAERQEQESLLHQSLSLLDTDAREILVMSRFQKMKYEEIAQIHDLTVAAVKVRVHRAIKKFFKFFLRPFGKI